MNSNTFVYIYFFMGVFFALLSIYLSAKPFSMGTFPVFAPYGIIITGFLAGVCFCVSAYLVKKT